MSKSNTNFYGHPPRLAAAGVLLLLVLVVAMASGCKPIQSAADAHAPSAQTPDTATTGHMSPRAQAMEDSRKTEAQTGFDAIQGLLKQDMAYGDLRKIVLAHGWEPLPDPQCRANVIGGDEKTCEANPDLAICRACTDIKELSAYSGDGYALTRFRNAVLGQQLEVTSYGMIEDWNASDADSRLRVTEWKVSKAGASP